MISGGAITILGFQRPQKKHLPFQLQSSQYVIKQPQELFLQKFQEQPLRQVKKKKRHYSKRHTVQVSFITPRKWRPCFTANRSRRTFRLSDEKYSGHFSAYLQSSPWSLLCGGTCLLSVRHFSNLLFLSNAEMLWDSLWQIQTFTRNRPMLSLVSRIKFIHILFLSH